MNKIVILPGWDSNSTSAWIPNTLKKLTDIGQKTLALDIPFSDFPIKDIWDFYLEKYVGKPSENKIVITESFAIHPLLQYMQNFDTDKKFNAVISIAPFMKINYEPVIKLAKYKLYLSGIPESLHKTRLNIQKKTITKLGKKLHKF